MKNYDNFNYVFRYHYYRHCCVSWYESNGGFIMMTKEEKKKIKELNKQMEKIFNDDWNETFKEKKERIAKEDANIQRVDAQVKGVKW